MSILITTEELDSISEEIEGNREAVERLAEFASEQASNAAQYKDGMVNNFERVMELLDELDAVHLSRNENVGEVEMWRGLCHARAVQLNEAYKTIAALQDDVDALQRTVDDLISH